MPLNDSVGQPCTLTLGSRRYDARLLGVARDTVWVTFPQFEYSAVGEPVDLTLGSTPDGPCYHMQVALVSDEADGGAVLQRTGMLRAQQRTSWRVPVSFISKIWQGESRETHPVHVLDLSMGGARVKARANLQLGSLATIMLALPDERPFAVPCQIIRGVPQKDGTRMYGLAFHSMPAEASRVLTVYLWKAIRERYPEAIEALYPRGTPKAV